MNAHTAPADMVSRRRLYRERRAREEAEFLLEQRSRELFFVNQKLSEYTEGLERAVEERTEELRRALQAAEDASLARSRFIATMSHEIRTPLGGLLGMIDLLSMQETDDEKSQLLDYAKTSAEALKRIVNDVLDYSRIEAGTLEFQRDNVDIRALINSVLALTRTVVEDSEDRLHMTVDDGVPYLFVGDATRIRQVLSNLVTNAVRYSKSGPITVRAFCPPDQLGKTLRVEVEDHGIGISKLQQTRLFKDFTQIENELTAAAQGAGLGLAICKRIVNGCGGSIGVRSTPGVGSTFWFELPLEEVAAKPDSQPATALPLNGTLQVDVTGARVLLAEDNPINQKLFRTYFDKMGIEVDLAENGQVAIEKFKPGRYDVVLLDVAMPKMDGLSAMRHLKEIWADKDLPPVAFLTAHVFNAIQEECIAAGGSRVIGKPATYQDLLGALQELLAAATPNPGAAAQRRRRTFRVVETAPVIPAAILRMMDKTIAESLTASMSADNIRQLLSDFLVDGRRLVNDIVSQHDRGDFQGVSDAAHALRGSSGLLGFGEIAELAAIAEDSAQDLDTESTNDIRDGISIVLGQIENALS